MNGQTGAMARWPSALLPLATVTMLAACGAPQEQSDAAAAVARDLLAAANAGDGNAACDLLAPETRRAVEQSAGKPCADAIADEHLSPPGPIQTIDVYGQWARVVLAGDTVFLGAFGDGWRVVAAGCRPRGERPYDCDVKG